MDYRAPSVNYSSLFSTINNADRATTQAQFSNYEASRNSQYNNTMQKYYDKVSDKADEPARKVEHATYAKTASGQADVLEEKQSQYERPYTGNGTYGGSSFIGGHFDAGF